MLRFGTTPENPKQKKKTFSKFIRIFNHNKARRKIHAFISITPFILKNNYIESILTNLKILRTIFSLIPFFKYLKSIFTNPKIFRQFFCLYLFFHADNSRKNHYTNNFRDNHKRHKVKYIIATRIP